MALQLVHDDEEDCYLEDERFIRPIYKKKKVKRAD